MDIRNYLAIPDEKPLDNMPSDGGFCGIFRTIGCIGDSLSSGEFESFDENGTGYHDYFEYSWGQYLARIAGTKVYNFSKGGMTAEDYCKEFAEKNDFWNPDKACQAYIIALGVNDLYGCHQDVGSVADIDSENYNNNKPTFAGYYSIIIQRLKKIQPKAKFFLMTMPRNELPNEIAEAHSELLYSLADYFDYTYVLDFRKYAPVYDGEFRYNFNLGGHMNPAGYLLTARMVASYLDYLIRHNMDDFKQIGFVGTPFHNINAKW